jgi:cell division inhibitor SepF
MSGFINKLKNWTGLNDRDDYYDEYDDGGRTNYPALYQQESAAPPAPTDRGNSMSLRDRPLVGNTSLGTSSLGNTSLGNTSTSLSSTTTSDVSSKMNSSSNIIGLPGSAGGPSEVVVMEPRSFEEMPQAIQALRERKSVVLNLTIMDPDQAQRAVDFIAGGTYALDGHQERIGESIFLFTPSCVQVSTQALGGMTQEALQPQLRAPRPPAPTVSAATWPDRGQMAAQ